MSLLVTNKLQASSTPANRITLCITFFVNPCSELFLRPVDRGRLDKRFGEEDDPDDESVRDTMSAILVDAIEVDEEALRTKRRRGGIS